MKRSRRHLQVLIASAALVAWACVDVTPDGAGEGEGDELLRLEVLESIADNVMAPRTAQFQALAAELEDATAAYAAAIAGEGDVEAARTAAQDAWHAAMSSWEVLEQLQLGPAGSSLSVVAGADLRDEIYSWPSINSCRVDQEVVAGEFDDADFQATRLVNVYGLDAMEYLLFWDSPDNTCAPQLPLNADGEWDALGENGVAQRRADYAAAMAVAIAGNADELASTWADGGDFNEWLAAPGEGDSPYASTGEAMDEVMRAMFYADLVLKDQKLAIPTGISGCGSEICVDELEFQFAIASKEAVAANLRGLREMVLGGSSPEQGTGFDDLLVDMGEEELAEELNAALDAAIAEVDAVDGGFREVLLADPAALDDMYEAIKRVTDLLKGDFATALMLTIPNEGAGDAD